MMALLAFRRFWLALAGVLLCIGLWLCLQPLHTAAATLTVDTTNDTITGGQCSLRAAITAVNSQTAQGSCPAGNGVNDTITFAIGGGGVQTIAVAVDGLPSLDKPMVIDGTTQPSFSGTPLIVVNGGGAQPFVSGVRLNPGASGSTVKGLVINGFNNGSGGFGIVISGSSNNTIAGNYIGTNAAGTAALPNHSSGVVITSGATNNTIGGTVAGARNLISGNSSGGVFITGGGTSGNTVAGNYLGTDVNGTAALPNGLSGVYIQGGATNNTIGGTTAAARNLISGNSGVGVFIDGNQKLTTGNTVAGNYIGTDAAGAAALPNNTGVLIANGSGNAIDRGATNNTIGGTAPGAGNLISGNNNYGVLISDVGTSGNAVAGNYIGTDAAGTARLANASTGVTGVQIFGGATNNTIGGTAAGAGNLISGTNYGVLIAGGGTSGNAVAGNAIGTDVNGTALPNTVGVFIAGGATNNTIGGTTAAARNLISGNGTGVVISDVGTSGNAVAGNYIGTDVNGAAALPNTTGVFVFAGATNNTIGGAAAGARNLIAFNKGIGVRIGTDAADTGTTGNAVRGNAIHDNGALGIDLAGDGVTANDPGDPDAGPNNLQNYPVLTGATIGGGTVAITGTLNSTANTTFHLDFYANAAADPSGHGEGQTWLGTQDVTTDGTGNLAAPFSVSFPAIPGQSVISATATNATTNDTSEFSADLTARSNTLPTLSINNVSQNEGNSGTTSFVFTVTLSAISAQTVTVSYATADGTATVADNDYQAASGTLTFTPERTSQQITVLVNGDTKFEPDETFTVTLSAPVNATIAAGTGTGTIINDDIAPTITVSPATLPNGTVGQAYSQPITASGGTVPYTFTVTTGTLPAGLTLATNGALTGTPMSAGQSTFTVTATDSNGFTGFRQYTVTITTTPVTLQSVSITCGTATGIPLFGAVRCTVIAHYSDGSTPDVTGSTTFVTLNASVATVDDTGKVTGKAAGSATITATFGGMTGQVVVTVNPPTVTGVIPNPAPAARSSGTSGSSTVPAPAPAPGSR